MLIVNADDWGRNRDATDRSLELHRNGRITAVSAMVFMEDSERAAGLARANGLDVGLHLNFTTPFNGIVSDRTLMADHRRIARFLRPQKLIRLVYHPALREDFKYAYRRQVEEYERLYGGPPSRIDGHHHMHLCANMLIDRVIPVGIRVRRNISYFPGERSLFNRTYRRVVDAWLVRRYRCTDYFFRLSPIATGRGMKRIADIACASVVELAVHPETGGEYDFLMSREYPACAAGATTGGFNDMEGSAR
jgi:chitin disaccharide deacetylase